MAEPAGWHAFQCFERDGWNDVAVAYAELAASFGLTTGAAGHAILDAADVRRGHRVVDLATGPGFLAGLAAARGAEVVGIDLSEAMVDEARRRYPGVVFQPGAAESVPLPDASCDAVVSAWGLPHFADHRRVFAEIRRIVHPGGAIAMATWAPPPDNELFAVLMGAVAPNVEARPRLPDGPDFFRHADPAVARAELVDAGFTLVEHRRLDFEIEPAHGADDLVRFLRAGSVRTRATYLAQPVATRRRIEADLDLLYRRYTATKLALRAQAVIISAR